VPEAALRLRTAAQSDAAAIAGIHAQSWRAVYRGIMPDAVLDGPLEAERTAHWAAALARLGPGDVVIVAEEGGATLGFIAVWHRPGDPYDAFIDNLHVRPALRSRGIGRRLLAEAAARLSAAGRGSAYLVVVEANRPAVAFYRRLGGAVVARTDAALYGAPVVHLTVAWTDLPALAAACAAATAAER